MFKIIGKGLLEIFAHLLFIVMRIISIIWVIVYSGIRRIGKIFKLNKYLDEYTNKAEQDFQTQYNLIVCDGKK